MTLLERLMPKSDDFFTDFEDQVEVLAATRDGQLNGYADRFTLIKANGRWDIASEGHVDM